MSKTYAIIDVANMFQRARFVAKGDPYTMAGLAMSIMFKSLKKTHRDFSADHMVFCCEGKSWRYAMYPQYKANRSIKRAAMTDREREEEMVFMEAQKQFIEFISDKTRCTVLQSECVEGDDFVARWVQRHPNDNHVIISGDSDFVQLLAPNVSIYNGVDERTIKVDGVYDAYNNPCVFSVKGDSGKIKVHGTIDDLRQKHDKEQREKQKLHERSENDREKLWNKTEQARAKDEHGYIPRPFLRQEYDYTEFNFEIEPNWWRKALFIKTIRGDVGDGIFSAYPKVRYDGTAKKVGIREAWEDRDGMGLHWNNFMLATWEKLIGVDANGNKTTRMVRVRDEYEINKTLIDLTLQPPEVVELMDHVIDQAIQKEPVQNVGFNFLRFCGRHDLPSLVNDATDHGSYLNKGYQR